jgi:hypothetical protein
VGLDDRAGADHQILGERQKRRQRIAGPSTPVSIAWSSPVGRQPERLPRDTIWRRR